MCSAFRFCLSVYLDLSPCAIMFLLDAFRRHGRTGKSRASWLAPEPPPGMFGYGDGDRRVGQHPRARVGLLGERRAGVVRDGIRGLEVDLEVKSSQAGGCGVLIEPDDVRYLQRLRSFAQGQ